MNIFVFLTPDIFKVFGERIDGQSVVGDFGKIKNAVGVRVGGVVDVLHSAITVTR